MDIRLTDSEENYLKCIQRLSERHQTATVNTNPIADEMQTKAASVTDMLKKLALKGMITYQPYYGASLTEAGHRETMKILRRHRLWEQFLVQTMGFKWDEVHDIAEELEHIRSERLIDKLDSFLGFPTVDPHGDPIPDNKGNVNVRKSILLSDAEVGHGYIVNGVTKYSSEFLSYLENADITIGKKIDIEDREEYDHSMLICLENKKKKFMSHEASRHLLVEHDALCKHCH